MSQPQFRFTDGLFPTRCTDKACAALADRHYSRRTPGAARFTYAGRQLVLRDAAGLVVFAWVWPRLRDDDRHGYHCTLFRNESDRLSSDIILEAERWAVSAWGPGPAWTFVDPRKVRSSNPGFCYLCAGWHRAGLTAANKRPPKLVLRKDLG